MPLRTQLNKIHFIQEVLESTLAALKKTGVIGILRAKNADAGTLLFVFASFVQ